MNRLEKKQVVDSLRGDLEGASVVIVTHYKGLTVEEITKLRRLAQANNSVFKVFKNSLVKLAIAGTQYENLANLFTGPTAITYSSDPVSAAKVVAKFANDNENLIILGGSIAGSSVNANGVQELSKLPSMDELRAKLIGLLVAPATRIAGLLNAPGGQVARVLGAYSRKEG